VKEPRRMSERSLLLAVLLLALIAPTAAAGASVPYQRRWGIYRLDLETSQVDLIYTCEEKLSGLRLSPAGDTFVFTKRFGEGLDDEEICVVGVDGSGYARLTDNMRLDTYPAWSPDGERIAFLAMGETLDIRVMDRDGGAEALLYDSGYHDADIHWVGDRIAFTRNFQVWVMDSAGSGARRVTDPPMAGEWGGAVLPFGDYDPRLSPDGGTVVYERMVDDSSPHGNYDLYLASLGEPGETRLTETGWTQGLASWSHGGDRLVFTVSAVGAEGRYDLYTVNVDGSDLKCLTGSPMPPAFLAHCAEFTPDDAALYFVGEWWDWKVLSTELACSPSSSQVELGENVTVTGSLRPAVQDAEIILEYTGPDGSTTLRKAYTDEDGGFSDAFEPGIAGAWSVEASWGGDLGHASAESAAAAFTAAAPDEGGGNAIPGYTSLSLLCGLALTVYFASRRPKTCTL